MKPSHISLASHISLMFAGLLLASSGNFVVHAWPPVPSKGRWSTKKQSRMTTGKVSSSKSSSKIGKGYPDAPSGLLSEEPSEPPSAPPSVSPSPTVTTIPSDAPSVSNAPSESSDPSDIPSLAPSSTPTECVGKGKAGKKTGQRMGCQAGKGNSGKGTGKGRRGSKAPSVSPAPSVSLVPSSAPSTSHAPSASMLPSDLPSANPSSVPSCETHKGKGSKSAKSSRTRGSKKSWREECGRPKGKGKNPVGSVQSLSAAQDVKTSAGIVNSNDLLVGFVATAIGALHQW